MNEKELLKELRAVRKELKEIKKQQLIEMKIIHGVGVKRDEEEQKTRREVV